MNQIVEMVERARAAQQPDLLCGAIPFAQFLGLEMSVDADGGLLAHMPFSEHLIGNPHVPALHGGTLGSLLETVAVMMALWKITPITRPRIINLTTDFLRPARREATFASGEFLRVGRRVVTVDLRAWQGEQRLVASGRAHLMVKR